jgi:putative protein-disulfide isomerase
MNLVYVGDPMCSWCYGFGKELTALLQRNPSLKLSIVVGGLRAGATDVLDEAGRQFRLMHWARVEEASGLPFNRKALLARENFIYDTEPICRAVVTAGKLAPAADLLAIFRALQHAFYVDGFDTTDGKVLAEVSARALRLLAQPISANVFYAAWNTSEMIAAAREDFIKARAAGVRSFPALLLDIDGRLVEVSPSYASVTQLEERLRDVIARHAHASSHREFTLLGHQSSGKG